MSQRQDKTLKNLLSSAAAMNETFERERGGGSGSGGGMNASPEIGASL